MGLGLSPGSGASLGTVPMRWNPKLLGLYLGTLSALAANPAGIRTPADLLAYLRQVSGSGTISGQYVETGDLGPINAIHEQTGKWLGLIGGDYFHYDQRAKDPPVTTFNASAISYWKAGGLIELNLHMPNPTTGGPVYDLSGLDTLGLLQPRTATHAAFMAILAKVAAGIRELQDAGVVVILRPFHENGGNWFWWGTGYRLSSEQFVALWRFTHDYFEKSQGLHNLVWLFESGQPDVPVTVNYPGDAFVDIVGQDVYTDHPDSPQAVAAYRQLVATGKLVCMSEFGPKGPQGGDRAFDETTLVAALRRQMPRTVFFQQWWDQNAGRVGWGMASVQSAAAALNSPWIRNRGDVSYRPGPAGPDDHPR